MEENVKRRTPEHLNECKGVVGLSQRPHGNSPRTLRQGLSEEESTRLLPTDERHMSARTIVGKLVVRALIAPLGVSVLGIQARRVGAT